MSDRDDKYNNTYCKRQINEINELKTENSELRYKNDIYKRTLDILKLQNPIAVQNAINQATSNDLDIEILDPNNIESVDTGYITA